MTGAASYLPSRPDLIVAAAAERARADAGASALSKGRKDPRSAERFAADLAAESDRSLRRDPGRWPWTSSRRHASPTGAAMAR